jgi:hypothetical protein
MKLRLAVPATLVALIPWAALESPGSGTAVPPTVDDPQVAILDTEFADCMHCVEDLFPPDTGRTAHWWVGTTGCGGGNNLLDTGGGCRECTSEHCGEPSVPHWGSCPSKKCGGEDPETLVNLLTSGDYAQLVEAVATRPHIYAFDKDRSALQMFGCDGGVIAHITVEPTVAHAFARATQ